MEVIDKLPELFNSLNQNSHQLIGFAMIGVFVLSLILFVTLASIFIFHWRKYGDGGKVIKKAEWMFIFGGSAVLFLMLLSLLSFFF